MKVALVTGGNRGLGLAACKELAEKNYLVILSARNREDAKAALAKINNGSLKIEPLQLDVSDSKSIQGAIKWIENKFQRLDVLINNAGIFPKEKENIDTESASPNTIKKTFLTNTLAPFELCQAVLPLMQKNGYGRIVNVSSGMGQLSEMNKGYPAYRISKTALNAVTKIFSEEAKGTDILVNSVCPGWVRTDMGGSNAHRSIEEGVSGIIWAATLPKNGPTGGFFRDGKSMSW